ncbi:hypothetical protein LIER_07067 [Lithospermum erythrorhizon]|uniref:Pentatricopeptide repeat-containing protein n=1 Tax=Lithospermum erythrorhizon TaxID=34254 RepID=A0AAV3P825_LITER
MSFWIQRAPYRIASIFRFHNHASHMDSTQPFISKGPETVWFIKVVCTLCIFRVSSSNLSVFSSEYFRKSLNPYVALRVIQHLTNQFKNPMLAFSFFRFTREKVNIVHYVSAFNMLLKSLCLSGLCDSAKLVFDYMNRDGYLCDSLILELLVRSFENAGKLNFAKEVLIWEAELSNERGGVVSPFVYNILLNSLVKTNQVKGAIDFFKDHILRLRSFSLSTSSFNIVIIGLCSTGKVDKAMEFFGFMKSLGCFPDTVTYNALINGFCKIGDVERARELIKEMQLQGGVSPNVVTYTSIISGCCKSHKMDEAVNLLDEMIGLGIRPNLFTFNVLIDGFGKTGDMVSVLKLYQRMLLSGFQPDVVTYTSLIDANCRIGVLEKGLKLLDEMDEKKLSPNLYTFSVLINALCKVSRLNEAHRLLRKLQMRDDIIPRAFIYNPVIDGFCKAGNVDEANIIVGEMEAKRCLPDKLTFTILILGHCMKGRMSEAITIFNKMLQVGCTPDKITLNCIDSCLLKAGMASEAYKIRQTSFDSLQNCSSSKRTTKQDINIEIPVVV